MSKMRPVSEEVNKPLIDKLIDLKIESQNYTEHNTQLNNFHDYSELIICQCALYFKAKYGKPLLSKSIVLYISDIFDAKELTEPEDTTSGSDDNHWLYA